MCLPVFRSGCFLFGIFIIFALLSLTIYTAKAHKPFAVWVSLLAATLLASIFVLAISSYIMQSRRPYAQLTCLRAIALGHLRYDPAQRGSGGYVLPMSDEEIELYHFAHSPQRSVNEDIAEEEAYRQLLATRPLPPPPAASPPRRDSPFPTLISPLSDPHIQQNDMFNSSQRLSAHEGGRTLRIVPESSGELDPIYTHVFATDQLYSRFPHLMMPLSQYPELRHELPKPSRQKHD
jgi:hypothetical protein